MVSLLSDYTSPISLRSSPSHNDRGLGYSEWGCFKTKRSFETLGDFVVRLHGRSNRFSFPHTFIFTIPSPFLNSWVHRGSIDLALPIINGTADPKGRGHHNPLPYMPRFHETRLLASICKADLKLEFAIEMPWV